MYKEPFSKVSVYRWKSKDEKILYTFDENSNTFDTIFQDDTMELALNKIASFIKKEDNVKFYAWVYGKSLLFSVNDKKWKGYNVNPFKSSNRDSEELNEPITYTYHTNKLFLNNKINIVFESDLPKILQKNKYYFTELTGKTYKFYKKNNDNLIKIKDLDASNVKQISEYFMNAHLTADIKQVSLPTIFDNLSTSKQIDMIQWVDDKSKILYKLFKQHDINKSFFNSWTNVDKIDQINVINIYSVFLKRNFCKISISDGNIVMGYILDSKSITYDDLQNHKKGMIQLLENVIKQPLKLEDRSLGVKINIEVHNSSFAELTKKLSENIDIFHVDKKNGSKSIECTYKRSSNSNESNDIYEHTISRFRLGISKEEIIRDLRTKTDADDIQEIVENVLEMIQNEREIVDKPTKKLKEVGTNITIQPLPLGYEINIRDSTNYKELKYLQFWLSNIISNTITKNKQKTSPIAQPKVKTPSPNSSEASSRNSFGSLDSADIMIDDEMDGGYFANSIGSGPKRSKNDNYLINMLQRADKDLFANNYARDGCQSASQPIVFSKEKKEELEKSDQMHFDNFIEYGSSENNQNFYACPKLWCPVSKVPLSIDDPSAKCPLEDESPMIMTPKEDKNGKRYVVLRYPKNKGNEAGLCVPCCAKKPPKPDLIKKCKAHLTNDGKDSPRESPKETPEQSDNDVYIMTQPAPIPEGRFGKIPEELHDILFYGKNIPPSACHNTLNKSHNCFVRKGIKKSKNNSSIYAIVSVLKFASKKKFVQDIQKKLTLTQFLSLDNGIICKTFMDLSKNVIEDKKLRKQFDLFKKDTKLYNICNSVNSSRALLIFDSYLKYIQYISSDDFTIEKKPELLYSMINSLYGIHVIVCERESNKEVFFKCPSYTELNTEFNPNIAIITKEGHYYEPVEMRMRKSDSTRFLKLNDFPKLKEVVSQCIQPNNIGEKIVYNNLYTLNNLIKTNTLKNSSKFLFNKIFINDDLTIDKILTSGNILITFDKIGIMYLPMAIKDFGISNKNIQFYADIIGKSYDIVVKKEDFDIIYNKYIEKNIQLNYGMIHKENQIDYIATISMTVERMLMPKSLILHTNNNSGLYNSIKTNMRHSKKWYELQQNVVSTILKKVSESRLNELHNMNRNEKINELKKLFDRTKFKNKIQIILEEIPTDSLSSLKNWLANSMISFKYDVFGKTIKSFKKNEFVFSQNALINNWAKEIPNKLLSYHEALPNQYYKTTDYQVINIDLQKNQQEERLPSIFEGTTSKLATKWIVQKKSKWNNMLIIKTNYTKDTIPTFVEWFGRQIGQNISYEDVINATRPKYFKAMINTDSMSEILQDPSFFNEWQKSLDKTFNTVQLFIKNVFNNLSSVERQKILNDILDSNALYTNDLHIATISEILNVSILVQTRGGYGKFDQNAKNRGSIEDFIVSSMFFGAHSNIESRPLIILNKSCGKKYCEYNLVVDKESPKSIYMKYGDVNKTITSLTNQHIIEQQK